MAKTINLTIIPISVLVKRVKKMKINNKHLVIILFSLIIVTQMTVTLGYSSENRATSLSTPYPRMEITGTQKVKADRLIRFLKDNIFYGQQRLPDMQRISDFDLQAIQQRLRYDNASGLENGLKWPFGQHGDLTVKWISLLDDFYFCQQ